MTDNATEDQEPQVDQAAAPESAVDSQVDSDLNRSSIRNRRSILNRRLKLVLQNIRRLEMRKRRPGNPVT